MAKGQDDPGPLVRPSSLSQGLSPEATALEEGPAVPQMEMAECFQ